MATDYFTEGLMCENEKKTLKVSGMNTQTSIC